MDLTYLDTQHVHRLMGDFLQKKCTWKNWCVKKIRLILRNCLRSQVIWEGYKPWDYKIPICWAQE